MCMDVLPECIYVHAPCVGSRNWNYSYLWAAMWMLGIQPGSSGRTAAAPSLCGMSLDPTLLLYKYNSNVCVPVRLYQAQGNKYIQCTKCPRPSHSPFFLYPHWPNQIPNSCFPEFCITGTMVWMPLWSASFAENNYFVFIYIESDEGYERWIQSEGLEINIY